MNKLFVVLLIFCLLVPTVHSQSSDGTSKKTLLEKNLLERDRLIFKRNQAIENKDSDEELLNWARLIHKNLEDRKKLEAWANKKEYKANNLEVKQILKKGEIQNKLDEFTSNGSKKLTLEQELIIRQMHREAQAYKYRMEQNLKGQKKISGEKPVSVSDSTALDSTVVGGLEKMQQILVNEDQVLEKYCLNGQGKRNQQITTTSGDGKSIIQVLKSLSCTEGFTEAYYEDLKKAEVASGDDEEDDDEEEDVEEVTLKNKPVNEGFEDAFLAGVERSRQYPFIASDSSKTILDSLNKPLQPLGAIESKLDSTSAIIPQVKLEKEQELALEDNEEVVEDNKEIVEEKKLKKQEHENEQHQGIAGKNMKRIPAASEELSCSESDKKNIADGKASKGMKDFMRIQGELTASRLAWAYLDNLKVEDQKPVKKIQDVILGLLETHSSTYEKDPAYKEAADLFKKSKLSRGALSKIMPHLVKILASQESAIAAKKPFLLNADDIKTVGLMAEYEGSDVESFGFSSDLRKDQSMMHLLKLVNSSLMYGADGKTNRISSAKEIAAQKKQIEANIADLKNKLRVALVASSCEEEVKLDLSCPVEEDSSFIEESEKLLKRISQEAEIKKEIRDELRFGKFWLKVKK